MSTQVKVTISYEHDDPKGVGAKITHFGVSDNHADEIAACLCSTMLTLDGTHAAGTGADILRKALLSYWEWGVPKISSSWEAACVALEKATLKAESTP